MKNLNTLCWSLEEIIDLTKYFTKWFSLFSSSSLWHDHASSWLYPRKDFLCHLINHFVTSLTTITSRQAASSRQTVSPPFPGEMQFLEEQRGGNRGKMKKAAQLMYIHDKDGAWWELLCSPHVDKRFGSQSVWRQLENSLELGLIESLSSTLCASWAVGRDQRGAKQSTTLWWDLEEMVGNV